MNANSRATHSMEFVDSVITLVPCCSTGWTVVICSQCSNVHRRKYVSYIYWKTTSVGGKEFLLAEVMKVSNSRYRSMRRVPLFNK